MAMRIEKSFTIHAPADAVWAFLTDPTRVASCLPGAAITGEVEPGTYGGTMTVKVGPVTASYRGKMRFERLDATAREAEIVATGQETRGKGAADMKMSSRVIERGPAETEVVITSDVNVVGVLAQFGKGMIQDVSDQMFGKFTAAMRRQLEPAAAATASTAVAATAPVGTAAGTTDTVEPVAATAGASSAARPPAPPPVAPASPAPTAGATMPRATEEVLDLGALGTAAAGRAATRLLHSGWFWIVVLALAGLVWLILR